ncbi:Pentafunctional AROM polypeptide 2 [Ceratocystis lukuohia]|uniref:Pentafunctional AROM polypeptide 2 n=1 Tax=Ceratocystis lukuohia TaxID=2019550 RepID=A0ABR4MU63_9PEZI
MSSALSHEQKLNLICRPEACIVIIDYEDCQPMINAICDVMNRPQVSIESYDSIYEMHAGAVVAIHPTTPNPDLFHRLRHRLVVIHILNVDPNSERRSFPIGGERFADYELLYSRNRIDKHLINDFFCHISGYIRDANPLKKVESFLLSPKMITMASKNQTAYLPPPGVDIVEVCLDSVIQVRDSQEPLFRLTEVEDSLIKNGNMAAFIRALARLVYNVRQTIRLPVLFTARPRGWRRNKSKLLRNDYLILNIILTAIAWGIQYIDIEDSLEPAYKPFILGRKATSRIIYSKHSLFEDTSLWSSPRLLPALYELSKFSDAIRLTSTRFIGSMDDGIQEFLDKVRDDPRIVPLIVCNLKDLVYETIPAHVLS